MRKLTFEGQDKEPVLIRIEDDYTPAPKDRTNAHIFGAFLLGALFITLYLITN